MARIASTAASLVKSLKSSLIRAAALPLALLSIALPAAAATISLVPTGDPNMTTLLLRGEIVDGDLGRLQAAFARVRSGQRATLLLESPGGLINEGFALGRFVHANRITTVAIQGPGCASSCTFVFLAGREQSGRSARIMIKGARVGFHQGSVGGFGPNQSFTANDVNQAVAHGQDIVRRVNAYFNEIKADPEFLTLFLSAPSQSLTFLNEFDALRLGIYVMDPATGRLVAPGDLQRQAAAR